MTKCRVESAPPGRDKNRLALEYITGTIIIITIKHGPIHHLFILLTLNLRSFCSFNLFPCTLSDPLIISDGFATAESGHFLGNCANQGNNHIAEFFLPGGATFFEGMEKMKTEAGKKQAAALMSKLYSIPEADTLGIRTSVISGNLVAGVGLNLCTAQGQV